MVTKSIKSVHGIVLVFAIDDSSSFDFALRKYELIKEKNLPFVFIGNKADLNSKRGQGGVSFEAAKNQAKIWGVNYMETSATSVPVNNLMNKQEY